MTTAGTASGTPPKVHYESDVPPWVVVQRRMEDLEISQDELVKIAFERYGITGRASSTQPMAAGGISEFITGKRWPPTDRPLVAILLVLDLTFEQIGLSEDDNPYAAAAVRGYRAGARPPHDATRRAPRDAPHDDRAACLAA